MLSERPYQSARSASAAVAELRSCSGGQFDPAVVDAFCAVMADDALAAGIGRLGFSEAVPADRPAARLRS